jgi:NAD(P)-dependent dehydrogenase (short-subunit alcohol dehydrogenase family)
MKSALVTGGNQGLGLGFVEHLLAEGWQVFATTRTDTSHLMHHPNLKWIQLDLGSDESLQKAFLTVSSEITSLDVLINNSGINKDTATHNHKGKVSTLPSLERDLLLHMFEINTVAPVLMVQKFLPLLNRTPSFVINISSCRASYHDEFENEFGNYGYRASKSALNMCTYCLVKDLPLHVKTFAVHPGSVRSRMNPEGTNEPRDQARKIISIIKNWNDDWNGMFMNYDGAPYPL